MERLTVMLLTMLLATLASGQPSLPPGVTLREIDGGPNYYQDNGFTYATNADFNGLSWDDPRFFPIGQDYSFYPENSTAVFKDLGLNFTHRVTGHMDLTILRNAGIWALPSPGEGSNPGPETIGWHIEEPSTWSQITGEVTGLGSGISGRLIQLSCTWNQFVYGGFQGTPGDGSMRAVMSSPISTTAGDVHINIPGADIYWFAGSNVQPIQYSGGVVYTGNGSATVDQMARGSNYGDMVDMLRAWMTTYPGPVGAPYIETEDGLFSETTRRRITPPEFNWAVWSTLVHGARWVLYFGTTSNYGTRGTFGFDKTILSGQTISMYDQAKATNTLIKNLAPIINSPFALNYASVTPAGYTFPTPHKVWDNGIDIMAKYYTGGDYSNAAGDFSDGFYIFTTVRGSASQTNINATFTIQNAGATSVTVVNEDRTIPITNGGTTFTEVFANAYAVHIYKVNGSTGFGGPVRPAAAGFTAARLQLGSNPWRTGSPLSIKVALGSKAFTRLAVYDLRGELVQGLAANMLSSGKHIFSWDGRNGKGVKVSNGLYLVKLTTDNMNMTKPVMVE